MIGVEVIGDEVIGVEVIGVDAGVGAGEMRESVAPGLLVKTKRRPSLGTDLPHTAARPRSRRRRRR